MRKEKSKQTVKSCCVVLNCSAPQDKASTRFNEGLRSEGTTFPFSSPVINIPTVGTRDGLKWRNNRQFSSVWRDKGDEREGRVIPRSVFRGSFPVIPAEPLVDNEAALEA